MDAVKLLKEVHRMCMETEHCEECPIYIYCAIDTGAFEVQEPEKVIEIIEKWSEEHSIKTRQSEFLKMFPNTSLDGNGVIKICPQIIEGENNYPCIIQSMTSCAGCREKYWLVGVD